MRRKRKTDYSDRETESQPHFKHLRKTHMIPKTKILWGWDPQFNWIFSND